MNYNYVSPIYQGVPQQNFQANNTFPVNSGMVGYGQGNQYATGAPPPIGFNLPYNTSPNMPNTCYASVSNASNIGYYSPQNPMGSAYYAPPIVGNGWYGTANGSPAQEMASCGYRAQDNPYNNYGSHLNTNSGNYSAPSSSINGGYGMPPTISGGVPVSSSNNLIIGENQVSNGYNSMYNTPSNSHYENSVTNPSAPFDNEHVNDFTRATVDKKENNYLVDNNDSILIAQSSNKMARSSNLTEKQKSADYQKGLDKLASLMNKDLDLSEDMLRKNREKYNLNVSNH